MCLFSVAVKRYHTSSSAPTVHATCDRVAPSELISVEGQATAVGGTTDSAMAPAHSSFTGAETTPIQTWQ
jgi:hypothetical protein